MASGLKPLHLRDITLIERVCSSLSLLGCLFIIATFCLSRSFHKPINRMIFYASFGNAITNVGTLMSNVYIQSPNSPGCQLQAFLIQMFMPADAYWALAMAINVHLAFYHKFDARRLRRMEVPYLLICYGIPLVPALTFIFVKTAQRGHMYGNAVLWCWIAPDWDIWRILSFYAPVWLAIVIIFVVYVRTGCTIYKKRKQLYEISSSDNYALSDIRAGTVKTTEITVTSEDVSQRSASLSGQSRHSNDGSYAVFISSGLRPATDDDSVPFNSKVEMASTSLATTTEMHDLARRSQAVQITKKHHSDHNNATWAYTKTAMLFFAVLLITWIPSSANRVYSLAHPSETNAALEYMSAFVLPLQGFWNAIIYIFTSWGAFKSLLDSFQVAQVPDAVEASHQLHTTGVRGKITRKGQMQ